MVSACLFGTSDDEQYVDYNEQHRKVISGEIEQLFDNGYRKNYNPILEPYEYSEDGFYLVESPEMLDSIFRYINYPGIDTLFPEDGMLLILDYHLYFGKEVIEYAYSFSGDTVEVDLTVREWLGGPYQPGIWCYVFPVGLTLR